MKEKKEYTQKALLCLKVQYFVGFFSHVFFLNPNWINNINI